MKNRTMFAATLVSAVALGISGLRAGAPDAFSGIKLPDSAQVVNGQEGMPRMGESFDKSWKPEVSTDKARGAATEAVYAKSAAGVVVVKLGGGHGTGFVIDPDGWILTNHHVASEGAADPMTGALTVTIHVGHMHDGFMKLDPKGLKGYVHKLDETRDLALIKLVDKPSEPLTVIPLAANAPKPGSDCVAIGHPASGALWSVRSGEVTGVGIWPTDRIDVALQVLDLTKSDQTRMASFLKRAPKQKVLYTNCGINSGDSGGPLLNPNSELVGVTFAMPSFNPEEAGRQGTTSYHVHLDEVREFIKDKPSKPFLATDPWPHVTLAALSDLSKDGRPDAIIFAHRRGDSWNAMLIDLKHESPKNFDVDLLSEPAQRSKWKFQLAIHRSASSGRAFYDTAGTGKIDLILTDNDYDGVADAVMRKVDGEWKTEPANGRKMFAPTNFIEPAMQKQMIKVLANRNVED